MCKALAPCLHDLGGALHPPKKSQAFMLTFIHPKLVGHQKYYFNDKVGFDSIQIGGLQHA